MVLKQFCSFVYKGRTNDDPPDGCHLGLIRWAGVRLESISSPIGNIQTIGEIAVTAFASYCT